MIRRYYGAFLRSSSTSHPFTPIPLCLIFFSTRQSFLLFAFFKFIAGFDNFILIIFAKRTIPRISKQEGEQLILMTNFKLHVWVYMSTWTHQFSYSILRLWYQSQKTKNWYLYWDKGLSCLDFIEKQDIEKTHHSSSSGNASKGGFKQLKWNAISHSSHMIWRFGSFLPPQMWHAHSLHLFFGLSWHVGQDGALCAARGWIFT